MPPEFNERQHYGKIVEHFKTYFPVPVFNPIMDGYFVHTISNFIDKVDKLKSTAPVLGVEQKSNYEFRLTSGVRGG